MRKKLEGKAGFTLVEMLAAAMILILLAVMLGTGLQMAMRNYRTVIAKSELELLVSTAVDALADDLRFAWKVKTKNGTELDAYDSDSYGAGTSLDLKDGQIIAKSSDSPEDGYRVLSTGAYGKNESYRKYKITKLDISYKDGAFSISLAAATEDDTISAGTSVKVRCLNPMKDATEDTTEDKTETEVGP